MRPFLAQRLRTLLACSAALTLGAMGTAAAQGVSAQAQGAHGGGTLNLREVVPLPATEKGNAQAPISDKTRRVLALQLLERVLLETARSKVTSASHDRLDAWVKKSLAARFQAYCPSFSARRAGASDAEVTVVFATQPFFDDLARAGFGTGGNSLRAATLVLDESKGELVQMSGAQLEAAASGSRLPTDFEVAGAASAAERAGTYGLALRSKLRAQGLSFEAHWSSFAARLVREALPQGGQWPQQALPPTLWNWNGETGVLFLFGVSRGDKQGIITRADVILVQQGKLKRSYWSRSLNDPTAQDSAIAVIARAAAQAQRLLSSQLAEPGESELKLAVDRKVAERELGDIEKALRELAIGQDALLIPIEVSRTEIRYRIPLPTSRADRVLEKLKREVPRINARLVPGDSGVIRIQLN